MVKIIFIYMPANYKSLLANQFAFKEVFCHSAHFKHKVEIFLLFLTSFAITDIIGVVTFSVCRRNSRKLLIRIDNRTLISKTFITGEIAILINVC